MSVGLIRVGLSLDGPQDRGVVRECLDQRLLSFGLVHEVLVGGELFLEEPTLGRVLSCGDGRTHVGDSLGVLAKRGLPEGSAGGSGNRRDGARGVGGLGQGAACGSDPSRIPAQDLRDHALDLLERLAGQRRSDFAGELDPGARGGAEAGAVLGRRDQL
ncbi:hypothetical protein NOD94_003225 [Streptomyces sp. Isolate_45]|nr:hypothetical protein [Streptomyces sp. Isolate_45]